MAKVLVFLWVLILGGATLPVRSTYYSNSVAHVLSREKKTNLHFFLHDTLRGAKPSAVMVAHSNLFPIGDNNPTPFGSTFVIDDPLTEGPEPTSKIIGNARGAYISTNQDKDLTLVMLIDFGFTTGKFNGSSFSVFSRNPVTEADREVAIVGGREKFRFARGFAKLKTQFFNYTNGDAVIEYHATILHY